MIRYAITDGSAVCGDERGRRDSLLAHALRLARAGVDYLQVREKDLPFEQASSLARAIQSSMRAAGYGTQVLLNAEWQGSGQWPAGVGLHLSVSALHALHTRGAQVADRLPATVSVSCHDLRELQLARRFATVLLFAPVFEKRVAGSVVQQGLGLEALADMCRSAAPLPVLAMGGVTLATAPLCLSAGAGGIAGIRLFHTSD